MSEPVDPSEHDVSRRALVVGLGSAVIVGPACASPPTPAVERQGVPPAHADAATPPTADAATFDGDAQPTPACDETKENPEGPFYSAGAPWRDTLLDAGMAGTLLTIRGHIRGVGLGCEPIQNASLDVWQADSVGRYDRRGFVLRGRIATKSDGSYELRTIVPGYYLDGGKYRPSHIHVKVTAPGYITLVTQLYFKDDPYSAADALFLPELEIALQQDALGKVGAFDFVLRTT